SAGVRAAVAAMRALPALHRVLTGGVAAVAHGGAAGDLAALLLAAEGVTGITGHRHRVRIAGRRRAGPAPVGDAAGRAAARHDSVGRGAAGCRTAGGLAGRRLGPAAPRRLVGAVVVVVVVPGLDHRRVVGGVLVVVLVLVGG